MKNFYRILLTISITIFLMLFAFEKAFDMKQMGLPENIDIQLIMNISILVFAIAVIKYFSIIIKEKNQIIHSLKERLGEK